ncbi:phosphoribosylglycinamide formyltransferase [Ferruginibacter lapsinanis]|uniref:phosphoribosylglycinamide formyltransferase n=1 Tax=Ferruginibacter lapsinanis TaxID=563172 RepID=UPI001E61915B|nr:phosphoribosylglycinamide formyltransferase [Ferruginibacter lapsinanis]UEG50703.1 phosphoribosylglycinamide formyltransferase [Ferruginibacter lapsinanis]
MLEKLKQRWGVNELNLILIICTFALGGSLCGYTGRRLLVLFDIDKGFLWVLLYIILITILWPFCVLLISIPLGQFNFFTRYLSKIWKRMNGKNKNNASISVAIYASGAGSNAARIIEEFKDHPYIKIALVVCNKPGAGVLKIATDNNIPVLLIEKERFFRGDAYLEELKKHSIGFIILAGFLWKIPAKLTGAYPGKIVNIHPALLPNYGGKGMYGGFVHAAVIANKEKESGISIHYVDELYDHGNIIFQAKCPVSDDDTPDTLAQKIHVLEHQHYPKVIALVLQQMQNQR